MQITAYRRLSEGRSNDQKNLYPYFTSCCIVAPSKCELTASLQPATFT